MAQFFQTKKIREDIIFLFKSFRSDKIISMKIISIDNYKFRNKTILNNIL